MEIEIVIESKNDYEYLLIEDKKAMGLEVVELRSGYSRDSLGSYREYGDHQWPSSSKAFLEVNIR